MTECGYCHPRIHAQVVPPRERRVGGAPLAHSVSGKSRKKPPTWPRAVRSKGPKAISSRAPLRANYACSDDDPLVARTPFVA